MKKFTQLMAVFAALVLALACFAACKNDSDDDGPKVVSTWEWTDDVTITVYIYDDDTVKASAPDASWTGKITSGNIDAASGVVTIEITSESNDWVTKGEVFTATKDSATQFTLFTLKNAKNKYRGTYTKQ